MLFKKLYADLKRSYVPVSCYLSDMKKQSEKAISMLFFVNFNQTSTVPGIIIDINLS